MDVNSEKLCRICLQNNGKLYLFMDSPENNESYQHKFSYCTSIKISDKDPMPKMLCTLCAHKLNDAYILRQLAHESDGILRKKFNANKCVLDTYDFDNCTDFQCSSLQDVKSEKEDNFEYDDADDCKSEDSEIVNLLMDSKLIRKNNLSIKKMNRSKITNVFAIKRSQEHHTKIRKRNNNAKAKDVKNLKMQINKKVNVDLIQTIKDTDNLGEKKLFKKKSITLSQLKDKCIKKKMKIQDNNISKVKRNNPVICEECGRKCKTMKILRVHKRVHRDDKPYHCDFCDWKFTWKGNRDMHVSTVHLQNKKYQCELCPKQFAYHKNLIEHRRIHTGEKPHVCDKCNRSFSRRFAMIRHRLTHTQARPYGCIHCHKTYTQCNDLKAHVKKSHIGSPTTTLSDYCLKLN